MPESCPIIHLRQVSENAYAPTKGSRLAAGYDLYSSTDCVLLARGNALVPTDIQICLPSGSYGRLAPRSGLALKNSLDVGAGVIDEDYRGNVGVILFNFRDVDFKITKGDSIAQLICQLIYYPMMLECDSLNDTERGDNGYGSTGIKMSENTPIIYFRKVSENAYAPTRSSRLAAGYDLYSSTDCVLPARGNGLVPTDIQISLPSGSCGRIAPISGLTLKNSIDVGDGVIYEDYRGNVDVTLFNFSDVDFKITKGDRIAQLICERIHYPMIVKCDSLNDTERGVNGYGSTGRN